MGSALKQGKSEALKARLNRGDWSKNSPVAITLYNTIFLAFADIPSDAHTGWIRILQLTIRE